MIKVKIAELAQKRGLKTAYALQKALGISPTVASRLWKGSFEMLGMTSLDKLCEHFNCQPADLLIFEKEKKKKAAK